MCDKQWKWWEQRGRDMRSWISVIGSLSEESTKTSDQRDCNFKLHITDMSRSFSVNTNFFIFICALSNYYYPCGTFGTDKTWSYTHSVSHSVIYVCVVCRLSQEDHGGTGPNVVGGTEVRGTRDSGDQHFAARTQTACYATWTPGAHQSCAAGWLREDIRRIGEFISNKTLLLC